MPLPVPSDYIGHRRQRVAELLAMGKRSPWQITDILAHESVKNPMTDLPYSAATIAADIKHIKAAWRAEAASDYGQMIADINAEIDLVKEKAWESGELKLVLEALKQKRELLGTDQPKKTIVMGDAANPVQIEVTRRLALEQITDEELEQLHRISAKIQPVIEAAEQQRALPSAESPGDSIIDADYIPDTVQDGMGSDGVTGPSTMSRHPDFGLNFDDEYEPSEEDEIEEDRSEEDGDE